MNNNDRLSNMNNLKDIKMKMNDNTISTES